MHAASYNEPVLPLGETGCANPRICESVFKHKIRRGLRRDDFLLLDVGFIATTIGWWCSK